MVSKADFKNIFQSYLKEMLSKKEKKKNERNNMELNDESLNMKVLDKLMEDKHNEIVSEKDYGSIIIENTNNLFHVEQTNTPDKSYIKNNKKNNYDEIAYPFSKRIKLKHEPESAPEINKYNLLRTLL
jgi:hypothetical protein